jgi:flagellar hook-associated protein 2
MDVTRISGLQSGMDTESLVKKLMDAERVRYNKMKQKQQTLQWKSDAYRKWNTDLFSFRSKDIFNMKLSKTYNTFTTSSSDSNLVSATASADALEGTHKIYVKQLAESATFKANINIDTTKTLGDASIAPAQKLNTNDTLTIKTTDASGNSLTGSITIKTTDKISDVINAINTAKDADGKSLGLQAIYDSSLQQFVIKTKATGAKTAIEISAGNNGTSNILGALGINGSADGVSGKNIDPATKDFKAAPDDEIKVTGAGTSGDPFKITGADALVNFDGTGGVGGTNIISSSNTITVFGVNYTVKEKTTTDVSITTTRDIETAVKNIKDFVTKYNEMVDKIYKAMTEPVYRDYQPLTEEQRKSLSEEQIKQWEEKAKSGLLRRDPILSELYNNIRNHVFSSVNNGSDYNTLASIGIKSNNYLDRGKLTVDEDKLREALAADPEGVRLLFSQSTSPTMKATSSISLGSNATIKLDYEDASGKVSTAELTLSATSTKDDIVAFFENAGISASFDASNKLTLTAPSGMAKFSLTAVSGTADLSALGFGALTTVSSTSTNSGIANRLYDDFYDAFQKTTQKAGVTGNRQDDQSFIGKLLIDINKRLDAENDRLIKVEDSYYRKFTAMEMALSKYNSQAGWLAQQFGGGR